jgi:hypothetical protein
VFVCGDHRLSVVKEKTWPPAMKNNKTENIKYILYIPTYIYKRESALFRPFITHHHHHHHLVLIAAPKKSKKMTLGKKKRV